MFLLEKDINREELNVKEGWKIEAEGRKMKSEILQLSKMKYGKARKRILPTLEEELVAVQILNQLELKEVEQNLVKQ